MKGNLKCRKGNLDNLWVMISFFALALTLMITTIFWNNVTTTEMDNDFWDKVPDSIHARADAQKAIDNFDNIGIIAYIAIHLGAIVLAYMLRTHPIVFVAVIIVSLVICIIAVPLSNTWEEIVTTEDEFVIAVLSYPKLNYIMQNLPRFEMLWTLLTGVCMFGFSRLE